MSIHTIYHVSVKLPGAVQDAIFSANREQEFDRELLAACTNAEASGSISYSDVELWADTPVRAQAEALDAQLAAIVAKWTKEMQK